MTPTTITLYVLAVVLHLIGIPLIFLAISRRTMIAGYAVLLASDVCLFVAAMQTSAHVFSLLAGVGAMAALLGLWLWIFRNHAPMSWKGGQQ